MNIFFFVAALIFTPKWRIEQFERYLDLAPDTELTIYHCHR